jgi:alkaline phosphatase D
MTQDLMKPITASMPIFAVQDDHDYGADDGDRTTIEPFAAQAFADMIPGATYPGRNYRQWSVGEAAFFLTDNRRWKDPEAGPFQNGRYMSVLGTRQRTWLLEELAASTAKVNFVFIPMTMAWYWSRAEAQEVQTFITQNVSGAVVFLSGDKHAGAVARYSPSIWEFLASPMSNPTKHSTGPRTSAVIWTENGTGPALYNAYGLIDVDTLVTQTCTLRLIREDGVEMHRQTVPLL